MSDELKLETYKDMWEQLDLFALVKTKSDVIPYIPIKKTGIIYPAVLLHRDVRSSVIRKMLDAGVEVLHEQPQLRDIDLWTKRKHEFVLVESSKPLRKYAIKYVIFHKDSGQSLDNPNIYPDYYDEICRKMAEAGVEIWSREKWIDYQSQK